MHFSKKGLINGGLSAIAATALSLAVTVPAFAEEAIPTVTGGAIATAEITKIVSEPTGTAPAKDITYTFTVTPATTLDAGALAGPALAKNTFDISSNDLTLNSTSSVLNRDLYSAKSTGFGQALLNVTYPKAGVYEYVISETAPAANATHMTLSQAQYTARVYVVNDGRGGTQVDTITVQKTKGDDGAPGDTKVDPTPGHGPTYGQEIHETTTPGGTDQSAELTGFAFLNKDWDTTTGSFSVLKKVAVTSGLDTIDHTLNYTFALTVNAPYVSDEQTFSYSIVDTNTAEVVSEGTITNKQTATITLKADQKIQFLNVLPTDTFYSINETGTNNAVSTNIDITENNVAKPQIVGATELANQPLNPLSEAIQYTNNFNGTTPTGLLVNNLPFVLMLGAPIAASVLYLVLKRRQRNNA